MKKRFTIMLEEETIRLIKALYNYYTPKAIRNDLESLIRTHTISDLSFHQDKILTKHYHFNDGEH